MPPVETVVWRELAPNIVWRGESVLVCVGVLLCKRIRSLCWASVAQDYFVATNFCTPWTLPSSFNQPLVDWAVRLDASIRDMAHVMGIPWYR